MLPNKRMLGTLVLLFSTLLVFSQRDVFGTVIDDATGAPILFATVTTTEGKGGTYTDENGRFTIRILRADSLHFTMLGYEPLTQKIVDDGVYHMTLSTYALDPVTVVDQQRKPRRETFGNSRYSFNGYSGYWGGVVARRVGQYTTEPGILRSATYRLDVDGNKCTVYARARLFANTGNRPGEDLLTKNVLIELKGGKNKYTVDFSEEQIVFPPGGLYVGVEFLVPGKDCEQVEESKRRFYVLMKKTKDPRSWNRRFGGDWGPLIMFSDREAQNAKFSVEVAY